MGITIKSKNFSLDCGYFGFNRLRDFVASKCPHENLRKCVEEFNEHILTIMRPAGWTESFNKKINDNEFLANKGSTNEEIETLEWFGFFRMGERLRRRNEIQNRKVYLGVHQRCI